LEHIDWVNLHIAQLLNSFQYRFGVHDFAKQILPFGKVTVTFSLELDVGETTDTDH